ncbi:MAG: hypothetical protein ACRYGP_16565 [Janthinobacterium lividum]
MSTEHSTSHAAEGDNAFVDKLRSLGLVRKAPAAPDEAAKPATVATAATPADPFGRAASKPPAGFVEVPAPAGTRTEPGAPRTRHYRAVGDLAMRHRTEGHVVRRPDPAA